MIENNTTYRGFIYDSKNKDEWNAVYFDAHIKDAGNLGYNCAGANTQRIVRKEIMDDWARRWSWLK